LVRALLPSKLEYHLRQIADGAVSAQAVVVVNPTKLTIVIHMDKIDRINLLEIKVC